MTLQVNEIHVPGDLHRCWIISAADRRITVKARFHSNRRKLFRIPFLQASVGYYGLAQVNQKTYLSEWLPNVVNHAHECKSLEEFARRLCGRLNDEVDANLLATYASGFHVCGFNPEGYPQLWHITNVGGMEGHVYKDFRRRYSMSEDFLERDARAQGFDEGTGEVSHQFTQYYVNGDVRAFHASWRTLDTFLGDMFAYSDFLRPSAPRDLVPIVEWKMQVVSSFYARFAKKKTIGTPIDVFVLLPT